MTDRSELEALAKQMIARADQADRESGGDLPATYLRNLAGKIRRLQPARVPEGWTEDRLRAEAKARGWYTREGTSVPTADGDWRHPFDVTIPSRDLCALLSAAPAAEGVITQGVAAHIKGRIDSLSPANNLSRFLDNPAHPPAEPEAGQREGVEANVKDALTRLCDLTQEVDQINSDIARKMTDALWVLCCREERQALIRRLASAQQASDLSHGDLAAQVIALADEREAGYKAREHGDVVNGRVADKIVALASRIRSVQRTGSRGEVGDADPT